ncbi:hypothetical protein F5Y06DRAFT_305432 [Hypoxylon sp. FL0890]|nr:hypothetical protein F5Y06DRAFT_305432 [Hypoxylon sp. FL0890]
MALSEPVALTESDFYTRFLCAFIQVPISLLDFEIRSNHPREFDDRIKARLTNTFSRTFEPDVPDNHVSGVVNEAGLESILVELQTTKEALKRTLYSGEYPCIQNTRIWCPADHHRVEAALTLFGKNTLWTVQLHCPPNSLPEATYNELIRTLSEHYSPRYNHSDGEVYRSIRRYEATRPDLVERWLVRLSASKKISLNLLYNEAKKQKHGQRSILEAFDRLLVYPGLWEGLELGNLHKHIALRCTNEIVRFLDHIYSTWDYITGGDSEIQRCVDINTARRLQSLAPSVSVADRQLVCALMDEYKVFLGVRDSQKREQIKQRILQTVVVIPSIKSFHENMKLFSIAARILRSYLLPNRSRAPLIKCLRDYWKTPNKSLVEFQEGQFYTVSSPPSFELAFKQVFLAAIRGFPELSDETPKIDSGDKIRATLQPSKVSEFYQRAFLLGFWSEAMQERYLENEKLRASRRYVISTASGPADVEAPDRDRRWGRPYSKVFRQIRIVAFVPQLEQEMPLVTFPTILYLQHDFIRAFLGSSTVGPCISNQAVSIFDKYAMSLGPIEEEMSEQPTGNGSHRAESDGDTLMGDRNAESTAANTPAPEDIVMTDAAMEDVQMTDYHGPAHPSYEWSTSMFKDGKDLSYTNMLTPDIFDRGIRPESDEVRSQIPSVCGYQFDIDANSPLKCRSQAPTLLQQPEMVQCDPIQSPLPSDGDVGLTTWQQQPLIAPFPPGYIGHGAAFEQWQPQLFCANPPVISARDVGLGVLSKVPSLQPPGLISDGDCIGEHSPRSQAPSLPFPEKLVPHMNHSYSATDSAVGEMQIQARSVVSTPRSMLLSDAFGNPNHVEFTPNSGTWPRRSLVSHSPSYAPSAGTSHVSFSRRTSGQRSVAPSPNFNQLWSNRTPEDSMVSIALTTGSLGQADDARYNQQSDPRKEITRMQSDYMGWTHIPYPKQLDENDDVRTVAHSPLRFGHADGFLDNENEYWEL